MSADATAERSTTQPDSASDDRESLLSAEAKKVVGATATVVAEHAEQITSLFYDSMFAAHPELLRVFNLGNQATGEQSRALAASVVVYAVQLIDPSAPPFDHVMTRIAYKHISLGIRPEQYTMVRHRRSLRVSTCRSLSISPTGLDNRVSTRCPRPESGLVSRSLSGGSGG